MLPAKISSRNAEILASSITLMMKVSGKRKVDLGRIKGEIKSRFKDIVSLTGSKKYDDIKVNICMNIEFDGMIRYDVTLTPLVNAPANRMLKSCKRA